jgi:hypothetical protein
MLVGPSDRPPSVGATKRSRRVTFFDLNCDVQQWFGKHMQAHVVKAVLAIATVVLIGISTSMAVLGM